MCDHELKHILDIITRILVSGILTDFLIIAKGLEQRGRCLLAYQEVKASSLHEKIDVLDLIVVGNYAQQMISRMWSPEAMLV